MKKLQKGFTLIEMLLVLVIMSVIVTLIANYTAMRTSQVVRERAAIQIEQILNAGLSYYINNGNWPNWSSTASDCPSASLSALTSGGYLPSSTHTPYISQTDYQISCTTNGQLFQVTLVTPNIAEADILAGMVPLGAVSSGSTVVASVNIPGQNLNNARAVNFAGYYHNGGCVPAPTCPPLMAPDILVVPVSLYGVNDVPAATTYYPLYGFSAYAYGAWNGTSTPSSLPTPPTAASGGGPADCYSPTLETDCVGDATGNVNPINTSNLYWRVCLNVTTEKGLVANTATSAWGQYTVVMAITRCVPPNENSGSDFTVWTK